MTATTIPIRSHTPRCARWRSSRFSSRRGSSPPDTIDEVACTYEQDIGPLNGAKVVARAWVDPEYKRRLLENGTNAIAELGFGGLESLDLYYNSISNIDRLTDLSPLSMLTSAEGAEIVVLESTPGVYNVVVCTLCSYYPWPVLGLAPSWYKDPAYRSRVVVGPAWC